VITQTVRLTDWERMNNELYSEISDVNNIPRGSPSFVQATLQQRLQNRINRLMDTVSYSYTLSPQSSRGLTIVYHNY